MFEDSYQFLSLKFSSKIKASQAKRFCNHRIFIDYIAYLGICEGRNQVKGLNLKPKMIFLSSSRKGITIRKIKELLTEYCIKLREDDIQRRNYSEGSFYDLYCTTNDFELTPLNLKGENPGALIFNEMSSNEFCDYKLVRDFEFFEECDPSYKKDCESFIKKIKEGLAYNDEDEMQ